MSTKTKTIEIPEDAFVEIEHFYLEQYEFGGGPILDLEHIGTKITITHGIQHNMISSVMPRPPLTHQK